LLKYYFSVKEVLHSTILEKLSAMAHGMKKETLVLRWIDPYYVDAQTVRVCFVLKHEY